jgi:Fe-S-cluster containining protein
LEKEGLKDILELFEIIRDWFGDVEIYPPLLRFNRCPFLLKLKDSYTCTIHDLKPEGFRSFPFYSDVTIHPWADKNYLCLKTKKSNCGIW